MNLPLASLLSSCEIATSSAGDDEPLFAPPAVTAFVVDIVCASAIAAVSSTHRSSRANKRRGLRSIVVVFNVVRVRVRCENVSHVIIDRPTNPLPVTREMRRA